MTYPPQPGGWSDPAGGYVDPVSGQPVYFDPATGQPTTIQPPQSPATPPPAPEYQAPGYQAPEYQAPGYQAPGQPTGYPTPGYPAPGYQVPGQPTGYAAPGYQQPYAVPPQQAYGYPAYPVYAPVAPSRSTNGMSIASLVVSLAGLVLLFCYGAGGALGLVGAILGHVSRSQIRKRDEEGKGLALAGIIVGWITVGISLIIVGLIIWAAVWVSNNSGTYVPDPTFS